MRRSNIWLISIGLVLAGVGTYLALTFFNQGQDVYSIKEVRTAEAVVVEKDSSEGWYVKVSVADPVITGTYVQTTEEVYQTLQLGDRVGVLAGLAERMKVKESRNREQLLIKNISSQWEVLSLYRTLAEAQEDNKPVSLTVQATLKNRVKSTDGRYFFLLDAGGRKTLVEVNPAYYNQYVPRTTPPDTFELLFEGVGEHTRFVRILKP